MLSTVLDSLGLVLLVFAVVAAAHVVWPVWGHVGAAAGLGVLAMVVSYVVDRFKR